MIYSHQQHTRTGRHRYRIHERFFGTPVLVLQIEMTGLVSHMYGSGPIDIERETWWRDATVEDLTNWHYPPPPEQPE